MLISADLPINRDKFAQQDQILTITGATWADYQQFESQEYSGYRVAYFQGEIIIVSPGRNHERIAAVINRLIIAYCEKYNISDFPFGQTRLNAWGQAGREPDLAYAFGTDKDLPDLAVEVIFSSGDIETLKSSYQNIGIPELWIWQNNKITFGRVEGGYYLWPLSVKSGHENFFSSSFRKSCIFSIFAHVDTVVATPMDGLKIFG